MRKSSGRSSWKDAGPMVLEPPLMACEGTRGSRERREDEEEWIEKVQSRCVAGKRETEARYTEDAGYFGSRGAAPRTLISRGYSMCHAHRHTRGRRGDGSNSTRFSATQERRQACACVHVRRRRRRQTSCSSGSRAASQEDWQKGLTRCLDLT